MDYTFGDLVPCQILTNDASLNQFLTGPMQLLSTAPPIKVMEHGSAGLLHYSEVSWVELVS